MELGQIRAFVAVAEEGSFTRAADRLHLVQSSISSAILALEAELGAKLLERGGRRSELTDAGRALLPEVKRALDAVDLAHDAVRQVGSGLRGSVSLGVMQTQAMHPLSIPGLLARFLDRHPAIDVTVTHVGGSAEMARHVREGLLDLGILALPRSMLSDLELQTLHAEDMVLACPAEGPLAHLDRISLPELSDQTFADLPTGWGTRTVVDVAFAAEDARREVAFELNDSLAVLDFVAAGLAVAIVPPSMIGPQPGIATVPIVPRAPTFPIQLVWPAERPLKAAAEELRKSVASSATAVV